MSADQIFTGFRCYCADCMGQGEGASADGDRVYSVPCPAHHPEPAGRPWHHHVRAPGILGSQA
jgi:hypothetical protein